MLSAMAKLLATLVTYPAIVIKSRMQVMRGFSGPVDQCAVLTVVQMWGWSSASALQQVWLGVGEENKELPAGVHECMCVCVCRWARVCVQAVNASTAAEVRYVGVVDAVARIIGAEGVAGLFKGEWVGTHRHGTWGRMRGCAAGEEGEDWQPQGQ